jgi:ABC-2 type transport system ATP-binding protein
MLLFKNVVKAYNGRELFNINNLELASGIHWLKGINGSGKSTLLKCIANIIPYQGSITVNGLLPKNNRAYKMALSYQSAEAGLPLFLTGNEMVAYYNHLKNANKDATNYVLHAFGINSYLNQKIATYSSGMQKKLALALAFIGHNKLIMLDEPLTTVDADSCAILIALIKEYNNMGTSFLITSHQAIEPNLLQFNSKLAFINNTLKFADA